MDFTAVQPGNDFALCLCTLPSVAELFGILQIVLPVGPIGLALSYKGRYCHATPIQRPAARFNRGFGRISSTY